MRIKKYLILFLVLALNESKAENSVFITFDLFQTKESYNHGIVFDGSEYSLGYSYQTENNSCLFEYEGKVKFGTGSGKGILGLNFILQPFDIFYGYPLQIGNNNKNYAGLHLDSYYLFSLYPDLQMGDDFWITKYSLSPSIQTVLPIGKNFVRLKLKNSFISLVSRPGTAKDPYNFSLRAEDIISDIHSNLALKLFYKFNATDFSADYIFNLAESKFSVGYHFKYLGFFDNPKLEYLYHAFTIKYYWGE